jgi:hypothetical protein
MGEAEFDKLSESFNSEDGDSSDLDSAIADSADETNVEEKRIQETIRKETKRVLVWRIIVLGMLLITGTIVTVTTYKFLSGEEEDYYSNVVSLSRTLNLASTWRFILIPRSFPSPSLPRRQSRSLPRWKVGPIVSLSPMLASVTL